MVLSPCKSGPRFVLFCLLGPPASTSTNLADSRRWSQSHRQRLCVVFSTLDLIADLYTSSPESRSLPPCLRAASSTKFLQAKHKLFSFLLMHICGNLAVLQHNTHTLHPVLLSTSLLSYYKHYPIVSARICILVGLPRYQNPVVTYYGSCFR